MKQCVMWLDKRRTFKLTPEAFARERELEGVDTSGIGHVAATAWLFLIGESPTLTVDDVKKILTDYLSKGWGRFRRWQIERLRTRLAAAYYDFLHRRKS